MRYICTRLGICSNGIQKLVSYEPQTEPYKTTIPQTTRERRNWWLTRLQAEMGWCTMGWPAIGKSGLGTFSDSGRNRVPATNTSTRANRSDKRAEGGGVPGWGWRGADLAALTFGGAADHDDGDDALLGAGHGCSASAPVAEWWGKGTRERRARATAWRDLWRWDGIWRGAWTAGLFSGGEGDADQTSEEVGNEAGGACVLVVSAAERRRAISGQWPF